MGPGPMGFLRPAGEANPRGETKNRGGGPPRNARAARRRPIGGDRHVPPQLRKRREARESIAETIRHRHRRRSFLRGAGPLPTGIGRGYPGSETRSREASTTFAVHVVEKMEQEALHGLLPRAARSEVGPATARAPATRSR